jgi:hypothetical protein
MSEAQSGPTFFERYDRGEVGAEQIDAFIEAWHDGDGAGVGLHDYLGLTWPEYQEWVKDPSALGRIARSRHQTGMRATS